MKDLNSPLNLLNLGLEVAGRDDKTFVLLLTSDLPNPFFQILSIKNQGLEDRLLSYLGNARQARRITTTSILTGEVLLLGFCDQNSFPQVQESGRVFIGSEKQKNLKLNVRRMFPPETPRFGYRHSETSGLEIHSTPLLGPREEIIAVAGFLQGLRGIEVWV